MNNSDNLLRLNVGSFYNKPIGTSREIPIEIETLEIEDLLVRNFTSTVRISRTREGLLIQITARAELDTTCVRCLKDIYFPVITEFEELYQFPSRYREETDLVLPDDGYIDFRTLYREYLILAMPIKRLCKPECKGLCVVCGADLNLTTCEHAVEQATFPKEKDQEE